MTYFDQVSKLENKYIARGLNCETHDVNSSVNMSMFHGNILKFHITCGILPASPCHQYYYLAASFQVVWNLAFLIAQGVTKSLGTDLAWLTYLRSLKGRTRGSNWCNWCLLISLYWISSPDWKGSTLDTLRSWVPDWLIKVLSDPPSWRSDSYVEIIHWTQRLNNTQIRMKIRIGTIGENTKIQRYNMVMHVHNGTRETT